MVITDTNGNTARLVRHSRYSDWQRPKKRR